MLFFFYFFIGHLIGDFLFQTSKIVQWKYASPWGITLHVFLVFLATSFMFMPYWYSPVIWGALIVNAVIHWGIDFLKVYYDNHYKPNNPLPGFFTDQFAHIATFAFILLFIPKDLIPAFFTDSWWFEYYEKINLLLYITGFLFFSYTMDIVYFMFQLKRGDKTPYSRSYYSMIVHTFIFALCFTVLWFFGHFYFHVF